MRAVTWDPRGCDCTTLRHFATSLAAEVPVRTVSERLGYANAATTLGVYAHFVEESDREAAAMLGTLIAPNGSEKDKPGK